MGQKHRFITTMNDPKKKKKKKEEEGGVKFGISIERCNEKWVGIKLKKILD
jgi:hypothetical protein